MYVEGMYNVFKKALLRNANSIVSDIFICCLLKLFYSSLLPVAGGKLPCKIVLLTYKSNMEPSI